MTIDDITRKEIEKKAKLFADKGKHITTRIVEEIDSLIKKLEETKKELIEEVETEFGTNIYAELLASIDAGKDLTDDEIKGILSKEIPSDFGPGLSSFNSLREEIGSLRLWKDKNEKKSKVNFFKLIPKNIKISSISYDSISVCWDKVDCDCFYEVELESSSTQKIYQTQKNDYSLSWLSSGTEYKIRVRTVVPLERDVKSVWSDSIIVRTIPKPYGGCWKVCPDYVKGEYMKYFIGANNHRIATKSDSGKYYNNSCAIIGNTPLPPNKVTSWSIKILKSENNNGSGIYIGVAPFDIDQNSDKKCGWYFDCCGSTLLISGPPHYYYEWKKYGPRKENERYIQEGDSVGVIMDTTKGELSFSLDGVNLGVAYEGIPLDKPLVPCVLLYRKGDSVELVV